MAQAGGMAQLEGQRHRARGQRRLLRLLGAAAMPLLLGGLCVLLLGGAFGVLRGARAVHLVSWAFLLQVGALAGLRRLRVEAGQPVRLRHQAEEGALVCIGALALAQAAGGLTSPLYALLYLLGAGFVLAHPLPLALGL